MIKRRAFLLVLLFLSVASAVKGQTGANDEDCAGPVYKGSEVSRRMKLVSYPAPKKPKDRRARDVDGLVILDVVACGSGKIANIVVVQGLPYGLTEAAIEAARKVKFKPAEREGQIVSQRVRFEYAFSKNDPT